MWTKKSCIWRGYDGVNRFSFVPYWTVMYHKYARNIFGPGDGPFIVIFSCWTIKVSGYFIIQTFIILGSLFFPFMSLEIANCLPTSKCVQKTIKRKNPSWRQREDTTNWDNEIELAAQVLIDRKNVFGSPIRVSWEFMFEK